MRDSKRLQFIIDLVIRDRRTQQAVCVLDTKYKREEDGVVSQDIAQVMAYAATQGCPQAMLIYPAGQPRSLTTFARAGHDVRLGVFELSGDLESAGQAFLRDLLGFVARAASTAQSTAAKHYDARASPPAEGVQTVAAQRIASSPSASDSFSSASVMGSSKPG